MDEYVFFGGIVGLARMVAVALFSTVIGFTLGWTAARLQRSRYHAANNDGRVLGRSLAALDRARAETDASVERDWTGWYSA
jgi:hypothetical protein